MSCKDRIFFLKKIQITKKNAKYLKITMPFILSSSSAFVRLANNLPSWPVSFFIVADRIILIMYDLLGWFRAGQQLLKT